MDNKDFVHELNHKQIQTFDFHLYFENLVLYNIMKFQSNLLDHLLDTMVNMDHHHRLVGRYCWCRERFGLLRLECPRMWRRSYR